MSPDPRPVPKPLFRLFNRKGRKGFAKGAMSIYEDIPFAKPLRSLRLNVRFWNRSNDYPVVPFPIPSISTFPLNFPFAGEGVPEGRGSGQLEEGRELR